MIRIRFSGIGSGIVTMVVLFGLTPGVSGTHLGAQDTTTSSSGSDVTFTIEPYNLLPSAPVVIKDIEVDGQEISPKTPIHLEGHWLGTVRVTVQNVSSKSVVYAGIIFLFPETGNGTPAKPFYTTGTAIGRRPDIAFYRRDGTKVEPTSSQATATPVNIPPGGTAIISYADNFNDQQSAAQQAGGNLTMINVSLPEVWFSDNTRWLDGNYLVPAGELGRWRFASADQFSRKAQVAQ